MKSVDHKTFSKVSRQNFHALGEKISDDFKVKLNKTKKTLCVGLNKTYIRERLQPKYSLCE